MSELKTNRSGSVYFGADVAGDLKAFNGENILLIGSSGHGFVTAIDSMLCNHVYMNNPKKEQLYIYHDQNSISPEWSANVPIIRCSEEETDFVNRPVLDSMLSMIDDMRKARKRLLQMYGSLPSDADHHITCVLVFISATLSLDTNPKFEQLLKYIKESRIDRRLCIDFVVCIQSHMPYITDEFSKVFCTPLGNDEFSRSVIGSDYAARCPETYGVLFYKDAAYGGPISRLSVQYRPEAFIRKLCKAFNVKKKNK